MKDYTYFWALLVHELPYHTKAQTLFSVHLIQDSVWICALIYIIVFCASSKRFCLVLCFILMFIFQGMEFAFSIMAWLLLLELAFIVYVVEYISFYI
jgi:hypothetical protein